MSFLLAAYLLTALVYAGLTVFVWRHPSESGGKINMALATVITALWALTEAMAQASEALAWMPLDLNLAARVGEGLRNVAWLLFALRLLIWITKQKALIARLTTVSLVAGGIAMLPVAVEIWAAIDPAAAHLAGLRPGVYFARLAVALAALACIENLWRNAAPESFWSLKYLCLALAGLFGYDFYIYSDALLFRQLDANLLDARAGIVLLLAPLLAVAIRRIPVGDLALVPSRDAVFHSASLFFAGLYLLAMGAAGYWLRSFGGSWSNILATTLLVAGIILLVVLAASSSLRARLRVFLIRNLFASRYDYRDEWPRFINTITRDGDGRNLRERVIKAIANIVDSPGGALWQWEDGNHRYSLAARWNYGRLRGNEVFDGEMPGFMADREWVADLRQPPGPCPPPPAWLAEDQGARLVVPLIHLGQLLGMVVLHEPRAPRPLNWEDWALLRIVGRQAASYLGELEATQALNAAREMELFNRRFAFVVHDIKTLIAQLSLLLRNADRHGDNPAFQREIVLSVRESVDAMNRILAQINAERQRDQAQAVTDVVALARTLVGRRRTDAAQVSIDSAVERLPVAGDETRLSAVLGHLINNAVEAAGSAGRVDIRLAREGERARIEVIDNGPGMDPEFVRDQLFRPFKSTKDAGYGIGAYQCRELIREMRGQLVVASVPGQGTTMRVNLALADASLAAADNRVSA